MQLTWVWEYLQHHKQESYFWGHQTFLMHALYLSLSLEKEWPALKFKTITLEDLSGRTVSIICMIYDPHLKCYWGHKGKTTISVLKKEMLAYYLSLEKRKTEFSKFKKPFFYQKIADESDCSSVFFQICDDQDYALAHQAVAYAKSKEAQDVLKKQTIIVKNSKKNKPTRL